VFTFLRFLRFFVENPKNMTFSFFEMLDTFSRTLSRGKNDLKNSGKIGFQMKVFCQRIRPDNNHYWQHCDSWFSETHHHSLAMHCMQPWFSIITLLDNISWNFNGQPMSTVHDYCYRVVNMSGPGRVNISFLQFFDQLIISYRSFCFVRFLVQEAWANHSVPLVLVVVTLLCRGVYAYCSCRNGCELRRCASASARLGGSN